MKYENTYIEELGVTIEATAFAPQEGVAEWHLMLHVEPRDEMFEGQMNRIYAAEERIARMPQYQGAQCVMKRYFLSDSTNQQPLMRTDEVAAVSIIQQQPMDGSKIAAWLYLQRGTSVSHHHGITEVEHNGYRHLWHMGMHRTEGDSARQTEDILLEYEQELTEHGATLADHCIRTWFFVRDVDTQYAGMVRARRQNFIEQGLTQHTHYISSTGIGGGPAETRALIQFGAYAITGFEPQQQRYLYAPTHLNPTYEYGVTFERGTVMEYADRAHLYISGTASINNRGEVEHVGNIVLQTQRMWENVAKLLEEGDASMDDVMQIIVYLRDTADYDTVRRMFADRFPQIPTVFTLAPVCRPTWLIEMECVAVRPAHNPQYRTF